MCETSKMDILAIDTGPESEKLNRFLEAHPEFDYIQAQSRIATTLVARRALIVADVLEYFKYTDRKFGKRSRDPKRPYTREELMKMRSKYEELAAEELKHILEMSPWIKWEDNNGEGTKM